MNFKWISSLVLVIIVFLQNGFVHGRPGTLDDLSAKINEAVANVQSNPIFNLESLKSNLAAFSTAFAAPAKPAGGA